MDEPQKYMSTDLEELKRLDAILRSRYLQRWDFLFLPATQVEGERSEMRVTRKGLTKFE